MDMFVVGSLIASVLVMIGALIDEFAPSSRARPEAPAAPMLETQHTQIRELEEQVPFDEAA